MFKAFGGPLLNETQIDWGNAAAISYFIHLSGLSAEIINGKFLQFNLRNSGVYHKHKTNSNALRLIFPIFVSSFLTGCFPLAPFSHSFLASGAFLFAYSQNCSLPGYMYLLLANCGGNRKYSTVAELHKTPLALYS